MVIAAASTELEFRQPIGKISLDFERFSQSRFLECKSDMENTQDFEMSF